jgi:hypothetical protein
MKVKRTKSSYVLIVGLMALLAAGSFLAYTIYSALTKSQITSEQKLEIRPLGGNLNQKAIDNVLKRRGFSEEVLSGVRSIDYSLSEKNQNSVRNLATDSGIVETATSSGELVP